MLGGLLLLAAIACAYTATRLSVPLLVAFLGLGMLLGSDGPGGIAFDDAELARTVGVLGLALILFQGGLTTEWRDVRDVARPALLLATVGVAVTAMITGLAASVLFEVDLETAILIGAVCGSTDAAAVFATLRATRLKRRLGALLEAESGLNDPMAVALTLGLIEWIQHPAYTPGDFTLLLFRQLGPGAVIGIVCGVAAAALFRRLPPDLAAFAPVMALACAAVTFGAAHSIEASGFLAVYLLGLIMAKRPSMFTGPVVAFHEGAAFLAQIVLFVVLGLLVFPARLGPVIVPGLVLAAALALVARPLAVLASTAFQGFDVREKVLLGWAGLRGAVPIVLATFALSEGIEDSQVVFDAVFFVVLVSVLVQGMTLAPLAQRLGLAREPKPFYRPPIESDVVRSLGGEILDFTVKADDAVNGSQVRDLGLPRRALVAMIVRGEDAIPPRGRTRLAAGDRLYVLVRAESEGAVIDVFNRWRSGPMPNKALPEPAG